MQVTAVLVGLVALYLPYYYVEQDPELSEQLDLNAKLVPLGLLLCVGLVLWFFLQSRRRILVLAILVGLCASVPIVLKQPGVAEGVIRTIVNKAGLPPDIFNHLQVLDDSVWYDIMLKGNLGIAEAYMQGKAKVEPFPLFVKLLNGTALGTRRKQSVDALSLFVDLVAAPLGMAAHFVNQQSMALSRRVTEKHYDAGNDLYQAMLGKSMSYTCAYWKGAKSLDEAQYAKFDLVYRKLELPTGRGEVLKVVDLGMGFGSLAAYVHEKAKGRAHVTGVSLSEQQVKFAKENLAKPGLEFIWADYREHCKDPANHDVYDRVYSVGLLEHVGFKNHAGFFRCMKLLLKPEGLAFVHTIGEPDFVPASDAFLDKYIFPGGVVPALSSLTVAFEKLFILEDFQNFGHDYAKTLEAWAVNAEAFFKAHPDRYTPEFQRMWMYYLKLCQALFELRINQLWQFVFSPRPTYRKGITRQL